MELAALKESLRKMAPAPAPDLSGPRGLVTGFGALDGALRDGGLPRGRISEITGAPSSGKTAIALAALARQTRAGRLTAFIGAGGELYPPAAAALGVELSRLLVARVPRRGCDAARAAEILARTRAFALIALDLPAGITLPPVAAGRLRGAAHHSGAVLVVLADRPGAAEVAAARVDLAPESGRLATGRARRVTALVRKGSRSGGPERAEIELHGVRIDDRPPAAVPPAITRTAPGAIPAPPRGARGAARPERRRHPPKEEAS